MPEQQIPLEVSRIFKIMADKDKYYVVLPYGIGDMIISGGLMEALRTKLGIDSVILIAQERLKSLRIRFNGVSEILYSPIKELYAFRDFTYGSGQYSGDNWIYGHFRSNNTRKLIWNKKINFVDRYKWDVYQLPLNAPMSPPIVENIDEEIKRKLHRDYMIDKRRTVIVAPYANSMSLMDKNFWSKIVHELKLQGYIIYTNVGISPRSGILEPPLPETLPLHVNLNEMFYLTDKVRCVIGLRSGLFDLLAFSSGTIICLQTLRWAYSDLELQFPQATAQIRSLYLGAPKSKPNYIRDEDLCVSEGDCAELIINLVYTAV